MSSAEPAPIPGIGTPAFYQDPYPTYRALLDSGTRAVRLSPQIVAVTQYRDCMDLLHDPRLSAKREERQTAHFDSEQKRDLAGSLQIESWRYSRAIRIEFSRALTC